MKRGTGGKEPVEHCWILFAIIGNGLQLLGKRHMAAVLGAQTQGETHRQNDTSLAGRPKDTNPYPWRDPYRGIHKGGRPPRRREAPPPLYGSLHGYGFVYLGHPASFSTFIVRRCVVLPVGFPMGLSTEPSVLFPMGVAMGVNPVPWNSRLVL